MDLAVDAVVDTLLEHRVTSIEPMLLRYEAGRGWASVVSRS